MSAEPEDFWIEDDEYDDDDYDDEYDAEDHYGVCLSCNVTYELTSAEDHCNECGTCLDHCHEPANHIRAYSDLIAQALR